MITCDTPRTGGTAACWALALVCLAAPPAAARPPASDHQAYRDAFPESVRGFTSTDWREKRRTLDEAIARDRASLPALIAGLRTSQGLDREARVPVALREVGRHCAIALGAIGDRSAAPALIAALGHPDRDTRREVIIALGRLGDPRAIDPLVGLWNDPREDLTNQQEAARALVGCGKDAVAAIASATIRGKPKAWLATAALLKIALADEAAVAAHARAHGDTEGGRRCREALETLRRRRQGRDTPPGITEIERRADALEKASRLPSALALWEDVIDSGLYGLQEDERARQAMLRIKRKAGPGLFKEPVATWRNKVFILAKYDADLPATGTRTGVHVRYGLSEEEIATVRQRFALLEKEVLAGSCGALRMENDITVVAEPWGVFRPTARTGPLSWDRYPTDRRAGRYQITRRDLDATFHYRRKYLARGYDGVFFVVRSDPARFEIDGGGAAAEGSVVNASRTPYADLDIVPQCHEWLHVLHFRVWQRGGFDWMQCVFLHDQLRETQLRRSWRTGRFTDQQEVFVEVMQKYMTTAMWRSIEQRGRAAADARPVLPG